MRPYLVNILAKICNIQDWKGPPASWHAMSHFYCASISYPYSFTVLVLLLILLLQLKSQQQDRGENIIHCVFFFILGTNR